MVKCNKEVIAMKKICFILLSAMLLMTACAKESETDVSENSSENADSIQQTQSEPDKIVLNEEETRQYELIKEQLPQLMGSLGISECTVSTPVYTIDYRTDEKSDLASFYVISNGELVSAVHAINNDVSLTSPVADGLNELFVDHTAFAWISGYTGEYVEDVLDSQGFLVSGYIYDGEWHQDPNNFLEVEIDDIDGYELQYIEDMGETIYAQADVQ